MWPFGRRKPNDQLAVLDRAADVIAKAGLPPMAPAESRWITAGQTVSVAGTQITGGLIYVGRSLRTREGKTENCLIDPSLSVASYAGEPPDLSMPYWPSYSEISPDARKAYLDWLADGRSDADAYVGLVFLYFYGLERRLLVDGAGAEESVIVEEVRRLHSVYEKNRSMYHYAATLLDFMSVKDGKLPEAPDLSAPYRSREVPPGVRLKIGNILQNGEALSADWTLAWYLGHPETRLKASSRRCFSEFVELFRQRFAQQFPGGMSVSPPRRRLSSLRYRSASGTFSTELKGDFEQWPDIVAMSAPLRAIDHLVETCAADLEPYSRALARNPSEQPGIQELSLLPRELLRGSTSEAIDGVRGWLDELVSEGAAFVPLGDLVQKLRLAPTLSEGLTKRSVSVLASALGKFGFSMEPDPVAGGSLPSVDSEIVLVRAAAADTPLISTNYLAARLYAELGMFVAGADGTIVAEEATLLAQEIRDNDSLCGSERVRVLAFLMYLTKYPPSGRLVAKLKARDAEVRGHVARIAVAVAAADGKLVPEEVRALQRIYKALDLPANVLFSDLQTLGASEEIPTVAPADRATGIPIPPAPARRGVVKLNQTRLIRVREDTQKVATILAGVFSNGDLAGRPGEEDEWKRETDDDPSDAPTKLVQFEGLEGRYAAVVASLSGVDEIARDAFDALSRKTGVMSGGAIEAINDWSLQRFGEPLLDDSGDPIEIAHHLLIAPSELEQTGMPA